MIDVKDLTKSYSGITTLHGLSFSINKGEIVGFLGPNGAGKTTTMRVITGYLPPSSGTVKIAGYDIVTDSLSARRHIGYLPENVPLYLDLTVEEYLNFYAKIMPLSGKTRKQEVTEVMKKTGLMGVSGKLINSISRGYRQRVGLAQALLGNPEVLILDEPTVGLDPVQIKEIRDLIKDLAKDQTVILSTHILPEVSQICNRVLIINQGKIVADSTVDGLLSSNRERNSLLFTVKGDGTPAQQIAQRISSVSRAVLEKKGDESILHVESAEDVRQQLLKQLIDQRIDLLEFRAEKNDLESVFLRLVTEERS